MAEGTAALHTAKSLVLGDDGGVLRHLGMSASGHIRNFPFMPYEFYIDMVTDDNDKTITVPAGEIWQVSWVHVQIVTTATVGNRILRIDLGNGTTEVWIGTSNTLTPASVNVVHNFQPGFSHDVLGQGSIVSVPWPDKVILNPGFTIRVYDPNDIDALDDLNIYIAYTEIDQ